MEPPAVQWRNEMNHIPNILTGLRIFCSALLVATPIYTIRFYLLYLVCGITDFLDGRLARKFHAASKAGASLDNIADYALLTSTAIKVLPTLEVEVWSLIWGICMLIAHVTSSIIAWVKYKRIVVLHTLANKLLGGAVYAIPLLAGFGNQTLLVSAVSAFMCFSVPEEIYLILTSKQLEPDVRGIFFDNSNVHRGYSEIADAPNTITDE
jgi:CDP-diacylglycerol--glycerol-3-phosphate 3-phosphatidyltransferase